MLLRKFKVICRNYLLIKKPEVFQRYYRKLNFKVYLY